MNYRAIQKKIKLYKKLNISFRKKCNMCNSSNIVDYNNYSPHETNDRFTVDGYYQLPVGLKFKCYACKNLNIV